METNHNQQKILLCGLPKIDHDGWSMLSSSEFFFNDLSGFIRMRHRPAYLEICRGISRILGKRIKSLISAHVSFSVWVTLCRNATCVAMTSIGTGRGQPQFGMFGARWCQSHFDVPIFLFEIQVQKGEV